MDGFFFKGSKLFLVDAKSPGGGELSLSGFPGGGDWGIEHQLKKKSQIPGGMLGGDGNSKN